VRPSALPTCSIRSSIVSRTLAGMGYRSQAYQAIIAYRTGCATFEFNLVDGVPAA
jgi:hypothetical protein